MSAAARREEIQLQLQQLREAREREQAAFDAIAAAHPELSAHEIAELAQQQAVAAVPQSIVVGGVEVCVGEKIMVKDDLQLLHRADRGQFAADVLKPIYLGEAGEVLRVMKAFQGKPAVELRFADGATKVFFAECLDLGAAEEADGRRRDAARHVDPVEGTEGGAAPRVPAPPPPPPKAEALPRWDGLRMPHRRSSAQAADAAPLQLAAPPPPPPIAAARATLSKPEPKPVKQAVQPQPAPARGPSPPQPAAPQPRTQAKPAAQQPSSPQPASLVASAPAAAAEPKRPAASPVVVKKESPSNVARRPSSPHRHAEAAPKAAAPTATAAKKQPPPRPAAVPPPALFEEDLGAPLPTALPLRASAADADADGVPDLRPTPETSLRDVTAVVVAATAPVVEAPAEAPSDGVSALLVAGRRGSGSGATSSSTRFCWLAGQSTTAGTVSEPVRIALQPQCTTMFAVFAVVTRKLQWDKKHLTASRLFTETGAEVKSAGAVQEGMRLVATPGFAYKPSGTQSPFAAVGDARPASKAAAPRPNPAALPAAPAAALSAPAPAPLTTAAPAPAPAPAATAAPAAAMPPKTGNASYGAPASPPRKVALVAKRPAEKPQPPVAKTIHIRVYENGQYDDNIYRTVTVRPTYKSLTALKSVITRELQWRDGKRVDLLFDASGAEVMDLSELMDGDAVVASAGDRFVIPYPNTAMHQEAMKLSERLR